MRNLKQYLVLLAATLFTANIHAQDEVEEEQKERGFKKENLITGGSANVSFGNNTTNLGISPYFGYSINRYIDVAASVGVNYVSQRSPFNDDKIRQTVLGPGAFVRVFPVRFLFVQGQYERSFISQKYIPDPSSNQPTQKETLGANSLFVGGGFASGRSADNKTFFYISVLWDINKDPNSPYTDNLNRAVPLIRTGFNIALFQD